MPGCDILHSFRLPFISVWSYRECCWSGICPHSILQCWRQCQHPSTFWIWLGGGESLPFWVADVGLLLSHSSQKWALPGSCGVQHEGKDLPYKHRMINKTLNSPEQHYPQLCSQGNKCQIRFLCLLSCFSLSYNTFEMSAWVKSSQCFHFQLQGSSGSEQDVAVCVWLRWTRPVSSLRLRSSW